jgi:hypothetical protein
MQLSDTILFTLGVLTLLTTEFIVLAIPEYFKYWFVSLILPLMLKRYVDYKTNKWQYFLLDFCYLVNVTCFIQILLPVSQYTDIIFQVNYLLANGPLAWAIVLWRNSLVFHSIDKVTSVYIHLFPILLSFCTRWFNPNQTDISMDRITILTYSILLYVVWQICYFLKTEYFDKAKLDKDCTIQTSLRWLSNDTKNGMHRMVLKLLRRMNMMRPDESFNPKETKTKIIFIVFQFLFTLTTFTLVPFMYQSFMFNSLFLIFLTSVAIYNGANYYIEVFSVKYRQQMNKNGEGYKQ